MARIKSVDTSPERALRSALWRFGLRYRLQYKTRAGKPDLAFVGRRIAVFIDGCFWHGCPEHYIFPNSSRDFWLGKLITNVERDTRQTRELEAGGWTVIRVWEHEICEELDRVVDEIRAAVTGEDIATPDDDWRLFRVDADPEDDGFEYRHLRKLRDPDEERVEHGPRVTKKWKNRLT